MGSYVLVSHQSQTCSSHRTESCITTRTPWLGEVQAVPEKEDQSQHSQVHASPGKNVSRSRKCTEGRNWRNRSCCLKLVRDLGCSVYEGSAGGRGRQGSRARDTII